MPAPVKILGVDPGLRRCGWGVIIADGAKLVHVAHGVVTPPTDAPLSARLAALFEGLNAVLDDHAPTAAAVEETFVNASPSSALKLGQARAIALLAPAARGLAVAEFAPRAVKKAVTGSGAADKGQIAHMISVLLPGATATADAADALAIAICAAHHKPAATRAPGGSRRRWTDRVAGDLAGRTR